MKDDKPLETDSEEQEVQEEGLEDVAGNLSLEELNEKYGRNFGSKEDFLKHYDNLNSLVGDQKRVEAEKKAKKADVVEEENQTLAEKLSSLEARLEEKDFLNENPDAKDILDKVKATAQYKGVSLEQAWKDEGLKDLAEAKKAREGETEIGVNSKNRVNSTEAKKLDGLVNKIKSGKASDAERDELLRNWPGAL